MIWKYFVTWIPGVPIAILNGLIRNSIYQKFLSELRAHQLSAISFALLFSVYVWFILKWVRLSSQQDALLLGLVWLLLTIVFEFIFGHYVMGHPWSRLFHDYNILEGRVWVLVLIWITIIPLILQIIRVET
jgi:hypothetical protein